MVEGKAVQNKIKYP